MCAWRRQKMKIGTFNADEDGIRKTIIEKFPELPSSICNSFSNEDQRMNHLIAQDHKRQFEKVMSEPQNEWIDDLKDLIPTELMTGSKIERKAKSILPNQLVIKDKAAPKVKEKTDSDSDIDQKNLSGSEGEEEALDYLDNYFDSGERYISDEDDQLEDVM